MRARVRDQVFLAQVLLVDRLQRAKQHVVNRIDRLRRREEGQTPTEYLMIVGLMAVVIITVFVMYFWNNVKNAAQSWVGNVKQSVTGQNITP